MLYEAAQVLLTHGTKWSWLRAWGWGWPNGAGYVEPSLRSPGAWPWFCTACGSMVASSAGARTAPWFLRRPEPSVAIVAGKEITRSASAEKCPHGDDGWGEFVRSADPDADQRHPQRVGGVPHLASSSESSAFASQPYADHEGSASVDRCACRRDPFALAGAVGTGKFRARRCSPWNPAGTAYDGRRSLMSARQ